MNTAHTRKMSAVLALAVGAALLAINAPIGHAAPGDGPGSDNTPPPPGQASVPTPLEISVSENPVFFLPNQTKKTINITWTPQPDSEVSVMVTEGSGGKEVWSKVMDKGMSGPLNLAVTYGSFYWVWVCRKIHDTCPLAIITTERIEITGPTLQRQLPLPVPGPPEINRTMTPQTPDLTGGQGPRRRVQESQPEHHVNVGEQRSSRQ